MAVMSFYGYIDQVPYYIHNTGENFRKTSIDIFNNEVKNISLLEEIYINNIITLQKKREDDILKQLFGSPEVDITKKFEEYGFILSSELTDKIIKQIDRLKQYKNISGDLRKSFLESKTSNNINLEIIEKEIDQIWDDYLKTINDIENKINESLQIINGGLESDLPSLAENLKKLKEFKGKREKTPQEAQLEELEDLDGRIKRYYQLITEGFKKKSIQALEAEMRTGEYSIIKEADPYRSNYVKGAITLAKSDLILIKKGEVIIPIGGISVKKTDSTTKFHNTTSITAFLKLLQEKGENFIDKKDVQHDSNILQYLMINRLIYTRDIYKVATQVIKNVSTKYGLLWMAGSITKEILNLENTNEAVKLLSLDTVFNSEHADFLYSFSSKTGINKVTRMSDELKKQYKKIFGFSMTVDENDKELREFMFSEGLNSLSEIKKEIDPYTYENAINNNLLLNKMNSFYKRFSRGLDIRITK